MTEIKTESFSNQPRILITGVSGLIGTILLKYLTETYPKKYQVFGLDLNINISSRYQANNNDDLQVETVSPFSSEKFFQCDVTDRIKLHQIIAEQNIDIIIHLAAVLEDDPDHQKIFRVNTEGTKNVFEAPNVRRVIFASSVMTVFGYLTHEPYLSIFNDTFDDTTMLNNLRKLTVTDNPPLPDIQTPGNTVYCQTKIIGEQMAMDIVKNNSISIICVRFGWVIIDDDPGTTWLRTVWFSHQDLCLFIDKALQAPLNISGIYFGISNNHRLWVDLDDAKKDLGYVPQKGTEKL